MKTWHERHTALFGAKIPSEMGEAWTAVWAAKGYTDAILSQAVLRIAQLAIEKRPQWPTEHIEAVERLSGQILLDLALAGRLGAKELMLAGVVADENVRSAQAEAKKKCVGFAEWDREKGLPEAKKYHQAKAVLEKIKILSGPVAIGCKADTNAQTMAKVHEILSSVGGRIQ